jgi:hypothetical protein
MVHLSLECKQFYYIYHAFWQYILLYIELDTDSKSKYNAEILEWANEQEKRRFPLFSYRKKNAL